MAQRSIARSVAQARYVAMGAARLAARVTREIDRTTRPIREALGDDPFFVAEIHNIQRYFGALLEAVSERLEAADRAYEIQKSETKRLRRQRDERARELYPELVKVRKTFSSLYADSVLFHLLGLKGKTPREPWPLLCAARVVVARLRDETIELPPARFSFCRIDRQALADRLEPKVAALDRAIDAVGCAVRDEDVLKLTRDEAWAELRQVKTGVSLFLEGLYRAAELHDLVPGIRNPRGSAARRKAGASKEVKTAAHPRVEAVEDETTLPHLSATACEQETTASHRKMTGAFLETTAPHRVVGREEDETTLPHQVKARVMHETTAPHQVDGGFEEPETPPHRVVRAFRLVKTADHGSRGGFGEPEPADHESDGGFGEHFSAEHRSAGAVEEAVPAAAGSGGRFWHAATLGRVARKLVRRVRSAP